MSNDTPSIDAQVTLVVEQHQIQPDTAKNLQSSFAPLFANARSVLEKSRAIVVTDVSQKLEIKLAREFRLALKNIRVEGDKTRKAFKEESLRRGKAIDGFFNILLDLTAAEEARLEEQEKYAERIEAERKAALVVERAKALLPFGVDTTFLSLGDMPEPTFSQLLENAKAGHEAKLAAARKAEEERIAAENARLKEEARIREENARLKAEADAAAEAARVELARVEALAAEEKRKAAAAAKAAAEKARKEREAIEAKAKAEREAAEKAAQAERLRLQAIAEEERKKAEVARAAAESEALRQRQAREQAEAELRAAREAEAARAADQAEKARQAALAPDREKILAFAESLRAIEVPSLSAADAVELGVMIRGRLLEVAEFAEAQANAMGTVVDFAAV